MSRWGVTGDLYHARGPHRIAGLCWPGNALSYVRRAREVRSRVRLEDGMRRLIALMSFALASAALAAEPASPAPAPEAAPAAAQTAAPYGKADGLIPGVLVGPKLALLPVPSLCGVGVEARILNSVGLTLDFGLLPSTDIPNAANADAKMEFKDLNAAVRWFPWSQRFYLGAAFGTRTFKARATESTTGLLGKAEVKSTYVAPELGWRFIWSSGFFMGIDLGWQIITSTKSTFDLPAAMNAQDQQDLKDAADELGKLGFPIVSVLQVGFYL
jgi:hypothetical protein